MTLHTERLLLIDTTCSKGGEGCMTTEELQEEFKRILEYGYRRGNEDVSIKTDDFIGELSEQLINLLEKDRV